MWHRKTSFDTKLCCGGWSSGYSLNMFLEPSVIYAYNMKEDADCKESIAEVLKGLGENLFLSGSLEATKQNISS